jgi:hypothetical protein
VLPLSVLYPALAFVLALIIVYALAMAALWRRWRGLPLARLDRTVLGLAGLGLVCFAEGTWVEPRWPEVTHTAIATPHLPEGAHVRIVHLSDLHCEASPRLEGRLPALVAAERPDLITFTGDAANSEDGWPTFRKLMAALARVAPTYAVKGNWDLDAPSDRLFGGTGAVELVGRPVQVAVRGAPVVLNGVPFSFGAEPNQAFLRMPHRGLRVFLYHTPDEIALAPGYADLYLAGHTHGGQVRLPLYGAVITMSQFGKRYEAGLYQEGGTALYVSRGIGMEGHFPAKVRFWCRPEIAVLDVVGVKR